MKIQSIESSDEKQVFLLTESSPAYSNALRRIMMSEVPTLAIEDVEFRKNTSALYDEIISHRLGLITLKTDLDTYNFMADCKCGGEGCSSCTVKFSLKVKGPKTVYASDLKSKDPKIVPIYPKTVITKLLDGQELEIEATAILGLGKEHSKWSPGHVYYKIKPEIKIDNKKVKNPEAVVASCPVNIFDIKNNNLAVIEKNLLNCHNCEACTDVSEGISFEEAEKDYVFYLESWGQHSPKDIISKALDVFNDKLAELEKNLK
ncbi:MAG: DNA-directed RNA polymerase subunit D [Nanoarchaeota archaeon]|nr:DNA-directed RNA polymerase subunit D [Nanoarchaeota archaeon]